ncbi:MAG: hypothetical protein KC418_20130 [Anaerolineales bacterium]|nr:hypothetical protein [Anaerolineales bacterium]MCB8951650.1 hypothetical protein [Ardenticatenales bacterium]
MRQMVISLVILLGVVAAAGRSGAAQGDVAVFVPLLLHTGAPPVLPEAVLVVTENAGINASTFAPHSFTLSNNAPGSLTITQARIDLRAAILPDLVFDPLGVAGDLVAKDLQIDGMAQPVGFLGHNYSSPHDGGYDILDLHFDDFDPGESVSFSVDVDPTSIRGVTGPGPGDAGSISGLEMSGAIVTITFDDGSSITAALSPIPDSLSGAMALVRADVPAAPTIQVMGVAAPPATVQDATQQVRVMGTPGMTVHLLVAEGGLLTAGVPGGGFDLDAYEVNSLLGVNYYAGVVDNAGILDIPITLTRSHDDGGRNVITASLQDIFGQRGDPATPIVLELSNN